MALSCLNHANHPDAEVQTEAAASAACLGRQGGLKILARMCLNPFASQLAQTLLDALHRSDLIPAEACTPAAKVRFSIARYLASSYGRLPDAIDVYDRRELYWPPAEERRRLWLLHYTYLSEETGDPETSGVALYGSGAPSHLAETVGLPPEDIYAAHCYYQMSRHGRITSLTHAIESGRRILQKHQVTA